MLRMSVHNSAVFRNILSLEGCLRLVTVAVVFGTLAACSSAGDTARTVVKNLNPVNWFDDDEQDKNKKPLAAEKQNASSKSFPKLGSVPARPKRPSPEAETKHIAEGLAADTSNARYTDQHLRQSTAVFGGNAQPPSTVRPSGPIARPTAIRRPAQPPAVAPPHTARRDGILRPPAIRPPAASRRSVALPKPRVSSMAPSRVEATTPSEQSSAPLVAPPPVKAPALARISPPPAVASTAVAQPSVKVPTLANVPPPPLSPRVSAAPSASPGKVQPPTLAKILAPSPQAVSVNRQRAVAPVAAPLATRAQVPTVVATPVAEPRQAPKPPPAAVPIGGPISQRIVSLQPPAAARVSPASPARSSSANSIETLKTVQVGTIYFGNGSSGLSSEDVSILRAVTDVFRRTGGKVRIVGHSSMGPPQFSPAQRESVNYRMSLKRANAVASELIRNGIPADSVEVIAEGDRAPVYAETSHIGAAYNRRVEIFIDYLDRS